VPQIVPVQVDSPERGTAFIGQPKPALRASDLASRDAVCPQNRRMPHGLWEEHRFAAFVREYRGVSDSPAPVREGCLFVTTAGEPKKRTSCGFGASLSFTARNIPPKTSNATTESQLLRHLACNRALSG
jgi:hypothetical protein